MLAGPVFILVFTIVGVILGIAADKYNRSKMLFVCTLVFGVAIVLQGKNNLIWIKLIWINIIFNPNLYFKFSANLTHHI